MTARIAKLLAAFVLFCGLQATCATVSHGQAFAFSVGSGGGGHHHHHHGGTRWAFGYSNAPYWGPGYWGPGYWGPPPIVYAPAPIVQPVVQPVYVQPQTIVPTSPGYTSAPPASAPIAASPAPSAGTSGMLAANTVPSLNGGTTADDRIVIRNAANAQLPVSFVIDGQDVELTDGGTRTFVGKTHRTIQYDRGGRFGSTQQDLTGGQYEFRVTSSGWDLVRRPDFTPSSRTAIRSNSLPESGPSLK
jgi:hypothetical protein